MSDTAMGEQPTRLEIGAVIPMKSDESIAGVGRVPGVGKVIDYAGEIDGGGVKASMKADFNLKPMLSLVPRALLWGVGRALSYGAVKYAANNWRRGMAWSEPASALLRHFLAWLEGEDYDQESGLHHLDSVGANLAFLMHMVADERYKELDDRP